jgi:hypothetical protein
MRRASGALLTAAPLIAASLPPVLIAVVIVRYGVNVPILDHWYFAAEMLDFLGGSYAWRRLWAPFGQHRIAVPKAVMFLLASLTGWDVRAELWFNFGVALASFALLADLARRSLRPLAPIAWAWAVLWISLALFSMAAWQSWTWGWMMNAYLAVLGASLTAWACERYASTGRGVSLMIAGGALTALSYLSGMLLLALVPVAIALVGAPNRRARHASVAALAAVALTAVYLTGYPFRAVARSVQADGLEPVAIALFALRYLGAPLAGRNPGAAFVWGIAVFAFVAASSLALFERTGALRRALVPWLMLAVFAAANGVATASGRLASGPNAALLSRYALLSSLFWVILPACAIVAVGALARRARAPWLRAATAIGLAIALVAIGQGFVAQSRAGFAGAEWRRESAARGMECVLDIEHASDRCLREVCPQHPDLVRQIVPQLARRELGPFAARNRNARGGRPHGEA